jgi:hypothetical protein
MKQGVGTSPWGVENTAARAALPRSTASTRKENNAMGDVPE